MSEYKSAMSNPEFVRMLCQRPPVGADHYRRLRQIIDDAHRQAEPYIKEMARLRATVTPMRCVVVNGELQLAQPGDLPDIYHHLDEIAAEIMRLSIRDGLVFYGFDPEIVRIGELPHPSTKIA